MPRFKLKSPGIYECLRSGAYYERPFVFGKRTWRKLDGASTLREAREVFNARRSDAARSVLGLAANPYHSDDGTVGELIAAYIEKGCPDRSGRPRPNVFRELNSLKFLREYWENVKVSDIKAQRMWTNYAAWRLSRKRNPGSSGHRAVDLDLSLIRAVFRFGIVHGIVGSNPFTDVIRQAKRAPVQHCRDFAPAGPDELHALAAAALSNRKSAVLGWQILLQAMTGCRTSEAVRLRWDAAPNQAGFVSGDWLWLQRSKGGVNPFAMIHPALRNLLTAMKAWRDKKYPTSPWFFPSPVDPSVPIGTSSLSHWMVLKGSAVVGCKRTAHGLRAYYVTVRRSQGISDAQIAAEIGDATGAAIIASTYGAIPPNWQGSSTPLSWTAGGRQAWENP